MNACLDKCLADEGIYQDYFNAVSGSVSARCQLASAATHLSVPVFSLFILSS